MPVRPVFIVTGAAGFVGANLTAALLARTPRPLLVAVDNFRSGSFANLTEACDRRGVGAFDGEVIPQSVTDTDWRWLIGTRDPAAVFHLGAITDTTVSDEQLMIRENVTRFDELLSTCAEARTPLVYASSAATYGTPPQAAQRTPFPVQAAGRPSNIYGFSKWLMECEHRRFAAVSAEQPWVVGLRYFNVFGPGESRKGKMASMVHQLAMQMLGGKRPRVFADGSQARDQVYVEDVVDCTMAAAGLGERKDPAPGVYNLGSGTPTSFNQVIAALRGPLAAPEGALPTEYFEMPASIRAFYQDYTCADMTATREGLGWSPRWKPERAIAEYGARLKTEAARASR